MTYSVTYRRSFFSRKIKRVKGDGFVEGGTHRYFICEDERRYEVPIEGTEFRFSPARFLVIKQNLEAQVGQVIPTKN